MLTEAAIVAALELLKSINVVISSIVQKAEPSTVDALLQVHLKHRQAVEGVLERIMQKIAPPAEPAKP
jgi:hypothetical protein